MKHPKAHRTMIPVAAICLLVVGCGDSPEDRLTACQEAGITDAAALESCKRSDDEKETLIAAFKAAQAEIARKETAERALKREEEFRKKEQEDLARREEECKRLIKEFPSVTPVNAEASSKAAEQFDLAKMERDEGYFGKCIDYVVYAINLAKGQ